MSWDVILLRIRGKRRPADQVGDQDYLPLGTRVQVVAAIKESFPGAREESDGQLSFEGAGFTIAFVPEEEEPVGNVILEVRGEGDPVSPILALAKRQGLVAMDSSTGEFIDPAKPGDVGWMGYRELLEGADAAPPPPARGKRPSK